MSRARWEMGAEAIVTQQPSSTKGFEHRDRHAHTTALSMFPHFKKGERVAQRRPQILLSIPIFLIE